MNASAAETLSTLAEAIDRLAAATTGDEIQRLVPAAARQLTGADGAALVLRERGKCHYVEEDAVQRLWKGRRLALTDSVEGWSILHREPVAIEDVYADERVPQAAYRRTFVKAMLVVPIRNHGATGAIGVYWSQHHAATTEEVAVVRALDLPGELRPIERDPLTGVLNRRAWDQLLASALRKGTRPLYIALLDLDHFKHYNDRHGHPAGDELLRRAARAWRSL